MWKRPSRSEKRAGRGRWRPAPLLWLERLEDRTLLSGDTLATATLLAFNFNNAHAGAFLANPAEVDLYRVSLGAGDRVNAAISAITSGSGLASTLRVFDGTGQQLALDDQEGGDPSLTFQAAAAGDYFIGVSSAPDDHYDPTVANSGTAGGTTGLYALDLQLTPAATLLPDVAASSFRLGADLAVPNQPVPVSFTVENRGALDPGNFQVQVLLANNQLFNGATTVTTFDRTALVPDTTGRAFSSPASFAVTIPPGQPSGPLFVGLRIVPDPMVGDASTSDKFAVHRGEDWDRLTVVIPAPAGATDLSAVDPFLNTQATGTLAGPGQVDSYTFTITDPFTIPTPNPALGDGRFTAVVTPTGPVAPRLTLIGADGLLIQSDSGKIVQTLRSGDYTLTVEARSGAGDYQLTTEFVSSNRPFDPVGVGSGASGLVVADLNGDGVPDLVFPCRYTSYGGVLLGRGDGTFQDQEKVNTGKYPVAVAVADVNGDGKPDLVFSNEADSTISVLLGNGDGSFHADPFSSPGLSAGTFAVGKYPVAVAVADLDGDGFPDVVVANYYDHTVSVLRGQKDGNFQPQQTFLLDTPQPTLLRLADVNGDGKPDLIVGYKEFGTVSVRLGNGDGTFDSDPTDLARHTFSVGPTVPHDIAYSVQLDVAVVDINGDGKPDLVASDTGTSNDPVSVVSVRLGKGDGTFGDLQSFAAGSQPQSVTVADVNNDGRPDLLVVNDFANSANLLLGNGDGTFQAPRAFVPGSFPASVAVADTNGDGRPDLLVKISYSSDGVSVLLGNGDGSFQSPGTGFATSGRPDATAVGDVNGDGKQDLVVANFEGNTVGVLLGSGDGTFLPQRTFPASSTPVSNPTGVALADLNGDGRLDLVVTNFSATLSGSTIRGSVSVLLGNGDGSFHAPETYEADSNPSSVAVVDVNGDGVPDLLVTNQYGYDVSVLLGNGDGTFRDDPAYLAKHTFGVGYGPASVAATYLGRDGKLHPIDFNGDGKPDLVVANQGTKAYPSSTVTVLLGNKDGTFYPDPFSGPMLPPDTFLVGTKPVSVVVADVDGDGKLDLVVASEGDGSPTSGGVTVLLGDGHGNFQDDAAYLAGHTFDPGVQPLGVTVADFNSDGIPDIAATNQLSNALDVLIGKGDGTFSPGAFLNAGAEPFAVAAADLNGDGRPDLVAAGAGDDTLTVQLGNGDGTFQQATPANGVGQRNTPFVADLSGNSASVILDAAGNVLLRMGLSGSGNTLGTPQTINTFFDPVSKKQVVLPARALTVLNTGTGSAIATADAIPDPAALALGQFVYTVSLYTVDAGGSPGHSTVFRSDQLPPGTHFLPTGIFAADLTDPVGTVNGLDDLVVTDSLDNVIAIAFQTAPGVFDPAKVITLPVGVAPSDVSFVNDHGLLDIAVADQFSGDVTLLLNDATHSFTQAVRVRAGFGPFDLDESAPVLQVASRQQSVSLAAAAFTGGSADDLVVVDRGTHSFSLLRNDGGGFLDPSPAFTNSTSDGFAINDQPGPVVAGDFNGDHKPDVAILMEDSAQVWIYTGDGHGHFSHTFSVAAGALPTGLSTVRNAQTGFLDLLVGDPFGDVLRLQGNGDGTFQPPPPLTGNRVSLDVQTVNGTTQALVANQQQNHVLVESATANGQQFVTTQTVVAAPTRIPFAPPDARFFALNQNDPTLDAIVLSAAGNSVQVYRPASGGGYVLQTSIPVGTDPVSVTISDVNGDGVPDLLVADQGSNDIAVLYGSYDANGLWSASAGPRLSSGGSGPLSVIVADVTTSSGTGSADGTPDLVVTNGQSGTMTVLPGVGQGFFSDTNPTSINLGGAAGTPSVAADGSGVVPVGNQLLAFNLNNLAAGAQSVFTAPAAINAAQALAGGGAVVALAGGAVEELQPADGALAVEATLESTTGTPVDPSALAVLETASALEVLVTAAGEDTVFVFTVAGLPEVMLPAADVPTGPGVEVSVPAGAPETVVVTLFTSVTVEAEAAEEVAAEGGGGAGGGGGAPAGLVLAAATTPGRSSGEFKDGREQEPNPEEREPGIDGGRILRDLDLSAPPPDADDSETTEWRPAPEAVALAGWEAYGRPAAGLSDVLAPLPVLEWDRPPAPTPATQAVSAAVAEPAQGAEETPAPEADTEAAVPAVEPEVDAVLPEPAGDVPTAADVTASVFGLVSEAPLHRRDEPWGRDFAFLAAVAAGWSAVAAGRSRDLSGSGS